MSDSADRPTSSLWLWGMIAVAFVGAIVVGQNEPTSLPHIELAWTWAFRTIGLVLAVFGAQALLGVLPGRSPGTYLESLVVGGLLLLAAVTLAGIGGWAAPLGFGLALATLIATALRPSRQDPSDRNSP